MNNQLSGFSIKLDRVVKVNYKTILNGNMNNRIDGFLHNLYDTVGFYGKPTIVVFHKTFCYRYSVKPPNGLDPGTASKTFCKPFLKPLLRTVLVRSVPVLMKKKVR